MSIPIRKEGVAARTGGPAASTRGASEGDAHGGSERSLCPVLAAIGVIGTEWRLAIVHQLLEGPQRFSELLRSNPRSNAKTLSATLKFLEAQGVVQRTVVSTRPFTVVYSLTEMGLGLAPAARELWAWGERYVLPRRSAGQPSTRPAAKTTGLSAGRPTASPVDLPSRHEASRD